MSLGKLWAGRAYGTNTGNLFVKLEGADNALVGKLHFNEPNVALVVYNITAKFDGNVLELSGSPAEEVEGVVLGNLVAKAQLNLKGEFNGEWNTTLGAAGTFILLPQDAKTLTSTDKHSADQLHSVRYDFGAIAIDRRGIISLADTLQSDFKSSPVMVTVDTGTSQSKFLPEFKKQEFSLDRAQILKLFVQEPEANGINRNATIEFGPVINYVSVQSSDEAWALGQRERLKREIAYYERSYVTNFKKWGGIGVNQLLLVGALVYLPDLQVRDRTILMVAVLLLIGGVSWLHQKLLPFAAIYLGDKPESAWSRIFPSIGSWVIAILAGVLQALLTAYLGGWLNLTAK